MKLHENYTCAVCGGFFGSFIFNGIVQVLKMIPNEYRDFYIIGSCMSCIKEQEEKYIAGLTDSELPLNINRPWVLLSSADAFKKRIRDMKIGKDSDV